MRYRESFVAVWGPTGSVHPKDFCRLHGSLESTPGRRLEEIRICAFPGSKLTFSEAGNALEALHPKEVRQDLSVLAIAGVTRALHRHWVSFP
jgi:hypothetical protein